jgi:hypothetical protein
VTPAAPLVLGSTGGSIRFDVAAVAGCSWKAVSGVNWARFRSGWNFVELRIEPDAGGTRRTTLKIGDMPIPVTQYGGPDPVADSAIVAIAAANGCLTSGGDGKLVLIPCARSMAQQFRLQRSRDLLYSVLSIGATNCLDMTAQRQSGMVLYHHPCHWGDHQLFQFLRQPDGRYTIFTTTGLQCLEARGDHLEQQVCNGGEAQKFRVATLSGPAAKTGSDRSSSALAER